jgi:isopenicillin N synthase-like dioxygenase
MDFAEIPVIDIAALRGGGSDGVDEVAAHISGACETAGFLYVARSSIDKLLLSLVIIAFY